ncbi:MAG: hypothetical protein HYZ25_02105 [Chloroflexi bacterium]|nr:hypothetical protein [Chloroflexota bacterium]
MNNKNTGIIATVAAALLCGCPGLASLCWGITSAAASFMPGADININGSSSPQSALFAGLGGLCVGIIFIAIPVVVGFLTLRKKPEAAAVPVSDEPLPPAS